MERPFYGPESAKVELSLKGGSRQLNNDYATMPSADFSIYVGAGYSVQRKRPWLSSIFAGSTWTIHRKRTDAHWTVEISSPNNCETDVDVYNAGNYPFVRMSPEIDYDMRFAFTRLAAGTVRVDLTGLHDRFPDFEAYADMSLIYKRVAPSSGPTLINLNRMSHAVNRSVTVAG